MAEKIGLLYETDRTVNGILLRTLLLNSVKRSENIDLIACDRILCSLRKHVRIAEQIICDLFRYDESFAREIFERSFFADEMAAAVDLWNSRRPAKVLSKLRADRAEEMYASVNRAISEGLISADPSSVMREFNLVREHDGKVWNLCKPTEQPDTGACIRVSETEFSIDAKEFVKLAFDGTTRSWCSVRFRIDERDITLDATDNRPLPFQVHCLQKGRMVVGQTVYELKQTGEIAAYLYMEKYGATTILSTSDEAGLGASKEIDGLAYYLPEYGGTGRFLSVDAICRVSVRIAAEEGIGRLISLPMCRCREICAEQLSGKRKLLYRRFEF